MTDLIKSRLRFGPFEVDLNARELQKAGSRVKLSGQPFAILAALLERPGQLVTRDELFKRVWSEDTYVDFSHGLNAAMNKLRESLCDSADEPRYIETLPRRGYRFIATVERVEEVMPAPVVPEPPKSEPKCSLPVPLPAWNDPLRDEQWQAIIPVKRQTLVQLTSAVVGILLIAIGTLGIWSYWQSSPSISHRDELRLKQNAERVAAEEAEKREKQTAEAPVLQTVVTEDLESTAPASRNSVPGAKQTSEAHRETKNATPSESASAASDDSPILRLANSGGHRTFFRERTITDGPAILRLDLSRVISFSSLRPVIAGRNAIAGPQPSPDGTKLVFMAGANEAMDLWVSNSDGSSPRKLTNIGRAGTPRWSPDGRWIAFDSDGRYGRSGIYVVSADGGPVRDVVQDDANNSVPSWSRDSKFIYFASNRGDGWEEDQIWKVPADGLGKLVQVTRQGGFSAYESMDGKTLYYAKSRYQNPEIWEVPVSGGAESKVSLLHPTTWASWTVTNKGILLLSEYNTQASELQYFDFATRSVHSLATLEKASFWLSSSANGSSIWYSELTDNQARQVFRAGF